MLVRAATGADAEQIARVQERGWQVAYRHVFPAAELERGGFIQASRWRDRLDHPPPGWSTFVAERDGLVVGFTSVGPSRDERGLGELYAIYVDPGRVVDRRRTRADRACRGAAARRLRAR